MTLRKAIVVDTHPEDNSVDLVMCDDGARLSGVPVLSPNASARTGGVDLPEVKSKTNKWDVTQRDGQDMEALVGFMGRGNPVVVGFVFPQISQMTFQDKKRKFQRHQSDVYHTIDGDGNIEVRHPNGTYVRIGEKREHEDLESANYDKSLKFDRNTDKKTHVRIEMAGNKASINVAPDGTITVTTEKSVTIKATEKITLDTPLVDVPNGDVRARGVSLIHHRHGGVKPGEGVSGEPVGASGAALDNGGTGAALGQGTGTGPGSVNEAGAVQGLKSARADLASTGATGWGFESGWTSGADSTPLGELSTTTVASSPLGSFLGLGVGTGLTAISGIDRLPLAGAFGLAAGDRDIAAKLFPEQFVNEALSLSSLAPLHNIVATVGSAFKDGLVDARLWAVESLKVGLAAGLVLTKLDADVNYAYREGHITRSQVKDLSPNMDKLLFSWAEPKREYFTATTPRCSPVLWQDLLDYGDGELMIPPELVDWVRANGRGDDGTGGTCVGYGVITPVDNPLPDDVYTALRALNRGIYLRGEYRETYIETSDVRAFLHYTYFINPPGAYDLPDDTPVHLFSGLVWDQGWVIGGWSSFVHEPGGLNGADYNVLQWSAGYGFKDLPLFKHGGVLVGDPHFTALSLRKVFGREDPSTWDDAYEVPKHVIDVAFAVHEGLITRDQVYHYSPLLDQLLSHPDQPYREYGTYTVS